MKIKLKILLSLFIVIFLASCAGDLKETMEPLRKTEEKAALPIKKEAGAISKLFNDERNAFLSSSRGGYPAEITELIKNEDYDEAAEKINEKISLDPLNFENHFYLSLVHYLKTDYGKAQKSVQVCLNLRRTDVNSLILYYKILDKAGKLAQNPNIFALVYERVEDYDILKEVVYKEIEIADRNNLKIEIEHLEKFDKLNDFNIKLRLAKEYFNRKNKFKGFNKLYECYTINNASAEVNFLLAGYYKTERNDLKAALNHYTAAFPDDRFKIESAVNLSTIYFEADLIEKADAIFADEFVRAHIEVNDELKLAYGVMLSKKNQLSEALKIFKELSGDSDRQIRLKARFNEAFCYQKLNDFNKAEEIYKDLIIEDSRNVKVYNNLAAVYLARGDKIRAEDYLQRALKIKFDAKIYENLRELRD